MKAHGHATAAKLCRGAPWCKRMIWAFAHFWYSSWNRSVWSVTHGMKQANPSGSKNWKKKMPKYARLRSNRVEYSRIKQMSARQVIRVSNVSAHRNPQPRTWSSWGCSSTGFCASVMVIPQLSMVSEAVFHMPALLECLLFSHLWNTMQHHVIIYNIDR